MIYCLQKGGNLEGSTQAIKNQQIHARINLFSRKKYQSLIFRYKIRLISLIHNTLSRMRLLGTKTEKSHSLYLIIYQVFKSIFSIGNETLRLFFLKKLFHVRESFCPFRATGLRPSLPRALPWARSFCPFRACGGFTFPLRAGERWFRACGGYT